MPTCLTGEGGLNLMHRALTPAIAQAICVGALVFFGIAIALGGFNILGSDFAAYFTGATIVNNGDGRSLYNIDVQKAVQSPLIFPYAMKKGLLPFNSPPWVVLPFLPLARLPFEVAYFFWFFVNVGLFLIGLRLLTSALPAISSSTNRLATMWLATVSFFPLFTALLLGQLTVVVFLSYALCFVALKKENWFKAGLALALALVKPQLVVALPLLLLYKRRWRALLGLGSGLGGLAVASVFIVGIPRLDDLISIARFSAEHWGCDDLSWRGLFCSMTSSMSMSFALAVAMSVLSLALLILAWRDRGHKTESFDLRLALAIPISLLISPHLFGHDLTLLILPAFIVVNHAFAQTSISSTGRLKVVAWVGVGYLVGLVRLFPALTIFGARLETIFLILASLALAKAILMPGSAQRRIFA